MVILFIAALGVAVLQPDLGARLPGGNPASTPSSPKIPGSAANHRPVDDPAALEAGSSGTITSSGSDVRFAFEGKAWARELFNEFKAASQLPDPILGARNGDFRGQVLNIRDGTRATWTPLKPELTVWYFGGSTMYGFGQRDDNTIPSIVAKLAAKDGIKIRSVNFGVSADVNWVETIRLAEALSSKREGPDLIVFYDGSNEIGLGFERVDGGDRDVSHSGRVSLSDAERSARAKQLTLQPELDPVARANLAAERSAAQYRRGVLAARSLAKTRGISVVHFWQPQPFARQARDADPELYARLGFDLNLLPVSTALYERIRIDSDVNPIDLSKVFDGNTSRIYMDGSPRTNLVQQSSGEPCTQS